jgi:hypothetical protein
MTRRLAFTTQGMTGFQVARVGNAGRVRGGSQIVQSRRNLSANDDSINLAASYQTITSKIYA